jgi:hypothetical protein
VTRPTPSTRPVVAAFETAAHLLNLCVRQARLR